MIGGRIGFRRFAEVVIVLGDPFSLKENGELLSWCPRVSGLVEEFFRGMAFEEMLMFEKILKRAQLVARAVGVQSS